MPTTGKLREFIMSNRDVILSRAHAHVLGRAGPYSTQKADRTKGLPIFLDQLSEALRKASVDELLDHNEIWESAKKHGQTLFAQGLSVDQVVHDYDDLCQVVGSLAMDHKIHIDADEFSTLNLCLDDAITGAVTEWVIHRERVIQAEGIERLGILAHEMRNLLSASLLSFGLIKRGKDEADGSISMMHERSLMGLMALIDRSLAEVRLDAGLYHFESIHAWELLEEVGIQGKILAMKRQLSFYVDVCDHAVTFNADRQILMGCITNLVQNALKFTKDGTDVMLRCKTTMTRVLIEIEDRCGGLPLGAMETILQPFSQHGQDRSGLGLGLTICKRGVLAMGGELRITDFPGQGCVFTIDLPKPPAAPTPILRYKPNNSPEAHCVASDDDKEALLA